MSEIGSGETPKEKITPKRKKPRNPTGGSWSNTTSPKRIHKTERPKYENLINHLSNYPIQENRLKICKTQQIKINVIITDKWKISLNTRILINQREFFDRKGRRKAGETEKDETEQRWK